MQAVQNNTITESSRFLKRLHDPSRPVLVFDGATGTSLQQLDIMALVAELQLLLNSAETEPKKPPKMDPRFFSLAADLLSIALLS